MSGSVNPGNFPLPIDALLKIDLSLPRNPVIAKLFRCVKLAENAGYGFNKMLKWEKVTNAKVIFANSIAFSVVKFIFPEELQKVIGGQTGGQTEQKGGQELSEMRQRIVDMISENPKISRKEIADQLNINTSAIQKHISKLKQNNVIERVGGSFGGYWKINK